MQDDSWLPPPFSRDALFVFGLLDRHGGTMRVLPLLQASHLQPAELADAVNELMARGWVKIVWRHPRARLPDGLPERFRKVERVTTTAFGRWRFPVTWSTR
jgi:hypothetical protein